MRLEKQPGFVCGIKCDICGTALEGDFTYYSIDARAVDVRNNQHVVGIGQLLVVFSFDACSACVFNLSETVRLHYAPTRTGINCDLCGGQLRGDFVFYYLNVSEVVVSMSNGALHCSVCNAKIEATNKPCKCGQNRPTKIAKLSINDKYLQIASCQRDYDALVAGAMKLRQQIG